MKSYLFLEIKLQNSFVVVLPSSTHILLILKKFFCWNFYWNCIMFINSRNWRLYWFFHFWKHNVLSHLYIFLCFFVKYCGVFPLCRFCAFLGIFGSNFEIHTSHSLKLYNLMAFGVFTELCNFYRNFRALSSPQKETLHLLTITINPLPFQP